jgi:hypothetical protein
MIWMDDYFQKIKYSNYDNQRIYFWKNLLIGTETERSDIKQSEEKVQIRFLNGFFSWVHPILEFVWRNTSIQKTS